MSRLLFLLQCLLAFATFGLSTNHPQCGSQAASCKALPAASTKSCLSVIASKKLNRATCTRPATTITRTTTVTPKASKVTSWRTVVQTKVSTALQTSTSNVLITSSATVPSTTTVPATTITTITDTLTSTTTTSIPYQPSTCIAARGLEKRHTLAKACSCFLTSTSLCGKATSVITKTARAPTSTVLSTATVTTTQTSVRATTILATQITTVTVTSPVTATSTTVETETETVTEEATATAIGDPCENPYGFNQKLSSSNAPLGFQRDGRSLADCCRRCYTSLDCVLYSFDPAQQLCSVFTTRNTEVAGGRNGCATAQCLRGNRVGGDIGRSDGLTYALGPCAGGFSS